MIIITRKRELQQSVLSIIFLSTREVITHEFTGIHGIVAIRIFCCCWWNRFKSEVSMFYLVLACCPQRHLTALVCCLGLTISYLMRFSLSIAITEMAAPVDTKEDPNACPARPQHEHHHHPNRTLYPWSEMQQGIILSSFFWGYIFTPVVGGLGSEHFGSKPVLSAGVLLTSLATFFTPLFIRLWDWIGLIAMRIVIGLAQGVMYAALHTLVAHWIPSEERGLWGTVVFTGAQVGNTISMLGTSHLLAAFPNWEIVFYLYAALGFLWTALFQVTAFSSPVDHPLLNDMEKEVLCLYMAKVRKRKSNRGTPWKKILSSKPVIVIIVAMIGHDWGMFSLVSDIPKYMKGVLHFNVIENGMVLAMGYFLICVVGILSGILVDWLENNHIISLTLNRKIMATLASLGPSFGLIGVTYSGCSSGRALSCLLLGMAFIGFYYPSLKINSVDLSPNFAGTVGALTHSVGGLSGILVPYVIGTMTPNGFLMEWRLVFWMTFVVIMITNTVYVMFASASLQPWNDDTEEDPLLQEAVECERFTSTKL